VYGVFERQFRRYFREAERKRGLTGTNLLVLLESRLDNVVYRLGFASSRPQARQLVRHGHVEVNGRKTNIPSFLVDPGDVVGVRRSSRQNAFFKDVALDLEHRQVPQWLTRDDQAMTGTVLAMPERSDIDIALDEHLIVEFYSR
jgi:small subunit ribosomal protein S4